MRPTLLLFTIFVAALVCESLGEKPRKLKKYHRKHKLSSEEKKGLSEKLESAEVASSGEVDEKKSEEVKVEEGTVELPPDVPELPKDPCADKHCGAGRVCKVTEEGKGECVCVPYCAPETDARRKVCSNHNETWGSDCEVYQMRCWCDHESEKCLNENFKHLHIDYYGACKQMPECAESEMADFPRRMRDWLFNIMRDMADRSELSPHYLEMEREAESNFTRRWTNAAIWKWCDLDGHPHDRTVSRHELFPIRAPLMSLEHCIAPFLNSCDVNDDHRITLTEWGKCLELPEDDLDEKCDSLRDEEEALSG